MAKDPAFLFYPNDWLGGTLGLSFEEKGAYMELLMLQFNCGHMTSHMIGHVLGHNGGQILDKIQNKFVQDDKGLWYNVRLEEEINKRKAYVSSRTNNIKGTNQYSKQSGHMDGQMTSHMENENKDNTTKDDKGGMGEKPKQTKPCTFTPPTEAEVIAYFKENGYRVDIAKKAFRHYNVADWQDTMGKKVKSWKQKMSTNWFREEHLDPNNKKLEPEPPIDVEKQIEDWMKDNTNAHENDFMSFNIPKWRKFYIKWLKYQLFYNPIIPESVRNAKIEEFKADTNGK